MGIGAMENSEMVHSDVQSAETGAIDGKAEYLTVVFKIRDHGAFDAFYRSTIQPLVHFGKDVPFQVTGWAVDDELYRSQLFYEAMERTHDYDEVAEAMEAIYQCPHLRTWDWEQWDKDEPKPF
jgi:hypothetical protein